jgi:DHA1 family bicyclomycin/chloramphenicol resistance-like MFS transporter
MPQSVRHPAWLILLLGSLCVVTPFAIDMYLPAFSNMAREYHTTTASISLSLSTYFVGFALGQLLYGPLLDRYGRKRPLYVGIIAYIVGSIGCALAPSLDTFIALRFFTALGGCVAQVAAIAMVRDFFPVKESARVFSLLFLVIGLSPLLAPTVGSLLVAGLGWRSIFILLASIAFLILVATVIFLPECHRPDHSVSLRPMHMLRGFWSILATPQFTLYTFAGAFSFSGLFAFVAGSPILFMDGFHMNTRLFGLTFAGLVLGFIGGNQINVLLLHRYTSQQLFAVAVTIQMLFGCAFFLLTFVHLASLPLILALLFVFLSSIGLTYPNSAAIGLAPFAREAGRASALLGFVQTGSGAVISMGIGILGGVSIAPILAASPLVAALLLFFFRKHVGTVVETHDSDAVVIH